MIPSRSNSSAKLVRMVWLCRSRKLKYQILSIRQSGSREKIRAGVKSRSLRTQPAQETSLIPCRLKYLRTRPRRPRPNSLKTETSDANSLETSCLIPAQMTSIPLCRAALATAKGKDPPPANRPILAGNPSCGSSFAWIDTLPSLLRKTTGPFKLP